MKNDIGFVHVRWGAGMVTVAFTRLPRDKQAGDVDVAFSFCAPSDHWDRKKGNKIAAGRLATGRCASMHLIGGKNTADQVADLLTELVHQGGLDAAPWLDAPKWMQQATEAPRDRTGARVGSPATRRFYLDAPRG